MNVAATQTGINTRIAEAPVRTQVGPGDFQRYIAGAQTSLVEAAKRTAEEIQHEQLTETARKWVSQTFFGTLLKQMRDSPFKSDLFGGGRGEEAFGPLYDAHLADRMARGAGRSLVDSIVKRIEGRATRRTDESKVTGIASEGGGNATAR